MQTNVSNVSIWCYSSFITKFCFAELAITPVQFLSINDSVKIHCHFKHDDKQLANDIKLEWFDGPLPMKAATNGITIKDSKTVTTIKSTLVFDKIQDLHFGRYTCKATSIKGAIKTATTSLLTKGIKCASNG